MEYQILKSLHGNEGKTSDELAIALERYVNEAIAEGWIPQGGVAVESWDAGMNLYQAMVRG